ncbi:MAG: hypothetical protein GY866_34840, partial [Proteobacteria bacterium]|nr:hypothetical protein [Pseudomonadota bacterium]
EEMKELEDREPSTDITVEEAVSVHFNRFNKRGLNVIAMYFKKLGYPVKEINPEDRIRKKDGMPTKKVEFLFENGQKILMHFAFVAKGKKSIEKTLGYTFSAQVDGKKVPVKLAKSKTPQTARTLEKMVEFLNKSAPPDVKRKKLLQASREALKIDAPKGPTSVAGKLKAAVDRQTEIRMMMEMSKQKKRDTGETNGLLDAQVAELESQLQGLQEESTALETELATLKAA